MRRCEPVAGILRPALTAAALLMLAGCGDNEARTDASIHDGGNTDAAGFPAPPVLGMQFDRAGRPGVGTILIGTFETNATTQAMLRDAYSRAVDSATWKSTTLPSNATIGQEIAANLARFDALDIGMTAPQTTFGCQNALLYGGGLPYQTAGDLFADDRIYLDTSLATCSAYFALELEYASLGGFLHMTCGGRMPSHDAIDLTYAVLAAGLSGLDPSLVPRPEFRDGATAHGDLKEMTFPFLGPPH